MDVFGLHERVVSDYARYVRSFITVRDGYIRDFVTDYLDSGQLWPEPLIQLNPSFQPGRTVDRLVSEGVLHRECGRIFRRGKSGDSLGTTLTLHQHQEDAIHAARTGKSYVLTTGTGSGKSLAYFIPVVDHILRAGPGRGIRAIIVYPMNALCNSQMGELGKFLCDGYPGGRGPVRFARYTGQESAEERDAVLNNPPDILLTNFVMLELIFTRPTEQRLVQAAQGLEYLVLDELHTYRGRQGADVSMLVRRVRERCGAASMRCVGTSATVAGSGTREERQTEVAAIASRLFGDEVTPERVIGETLQRATTPDAAEKAKGPAHLRGTLAGPPQYEADYAGLSALPLAAWAEEAFGLQADEQGRLERREPRRLSEVAEELSGFTGASTATCEAHLKALLLAGYGAHHPATGFPLFAFRLHQFISRGDAVYSTLQPAPHNYLTVEGQVYAPGSRERRLYPLAFCRECGQEYFVVDRQPGGQLELRELEDRSPADDDVVSGFLMFDPEGGYEGGTSLLPEDWLEIRKGNEVVVKRGARRLVPQRVFVTPDGKIDEEASEGAEGAAPAWFFPAPFRFCLNCGVTYASGRERDFGKLAELATEGRSTATTVLSLSIVRALRGESSLPEEARKLLSFTDNRQDASLQAGHFNDFVQIGMLRAALLSATRSGGAEGLSHDMIAQRVTAELGLGFAEYASNPDAQFLTRKNTESALRDVVGYRVYRDLRRGWRVTSPNLEQCGMLNIQYESLDEVCQADEVWQGRHDLLRLATPEQREQVCHAVLDYLRRELAIKVSYLDADEQERMRERSNQYLRGPWAFDEQEQMEAAPVFRVGPIDRSISIRQIPVTPSSLLGRYLRRGSTWPNSLDRAERVPADELLPLAKDVMEVLTIGGQVEPVPSVPDGYQIQAGCIRWRPGDGSVAHLDHVRLAKTPEEGLRPNQFFADFYRVAASFLAGMQAREHTAQVPTALRLEREEAFRKATLPVLYCSPTMELGVDIASLNAVNMRNVPPTPSNYAQRSGRAGRSGQPALVVTYCSSFSSHDQYYFRRPQRIVSGAVAPPRLDLSNEDLVRAHIHAVWLAETGQSLYSSVAEVLDLEKYPELPVKDAVAHYLKDRNARLRAAERCRQILLGLEDELAGALWYTPEWLDEVMRQVFSQFDLAADRWRRLYRAACNQRDTQHTVVADATKSAEERRQATRLRAEAETQINLLLASNGDLQSDFYSYRYFAGEGFLPGYNFPRLPLSAYLPGRVRQTGRDEYLTRPRFLAISEFGPRSIIYHEGNRFRVTKVILPPRDGGELTTTAKFCGRCGYGYFGEEAGLDRCLHCNALLDGANSMYFENLLRLDNVATRRVDRITSDEEERQRLGYDVMTVFRFAAGPNGLLKREADVALGEGEETAGQQATLARLTYAPTTTLWRVNLGWRRRKDHTLYGFLLDTERGLWEKSDSEPSRSDRESLEPMALAQKQRVVPFVEDRRNAMILSLVEPAAPEVLASLQYALKRGIQARYQLEDSELAVELLPSLDEPEHILFYEAAEGGAGVLSRLVEEPDALAEVARQALEICHFDPRTGDDLGRAALKAEPCEAACYDCLLSYTNQREHKILDRFVVRDLLLRLASARTRPGAGGRTREAQRDSLLARCESDLEREFVTYLYEHGYVLPDRAQLSLPDHGARPDFAYDETRALVYVDGAPHWFAERRARDEAATAALERAGFTVIRVEGPETWPAALRDYAWVFGGGSGREGADA
ncbi:MAG: DEAD/DEAH box helicase [Chloroflexota bacterium]